jgi:hypothetical protein
MVSHVSASQESGQQPGLAAVANIERLVEKVDALVPEADTVANSVLPDKSGATRWLVRSSRYESMTLAPATDRNGNVEPRA